MKWTFARNGDVLINGVAIGRIDDSGQFCIAHWVRRELRDQIDLSENDTAEFTSGQILFAANLVKLDE